MDDLRDFGVALLVVIALIAVLLTPIFGLAVLGDSISCANIATQMGLSHSYSLTTDCMINVHGQWIRLDSYRMVN